MKTLCFLPTTIGLAALVGIQPAAPRSFDAASPAPQLESELAFPLEHWHNHASMIVEARNGDLLVCWFHGSGERTAVCGVSPSVNGVSRRCGATRPTSSHAVLAG